MTVLAPGRAKAVSEEYGTAIATIYDDIYGELEASSPEIIALRNLVPPSDVVRTIVELGIGTGRVLGALGRALQDEAGLRLIGIDGSPELLARSSTRYPDLDLRLAEADFSSDAVLDVVEAGSADLVLCVCASFSMLPDRESQGATLRNIAAMLARDGVAVVETHSPSFVREVIGVDPTAMFIPYPRHETGLVCFSSVDDGIWRMRQVWVDGEESTTVLETSLLTPPHTLADLAAAAGLEVVALTASLAGAEYVEASTPMYAVTLRRAAARAAA
ncbi:class I SAM-dependent methyltransferase [Microbacterium sp. LWO14-1.2]|uniref:class I SAM-dependent methyltransferase n=1 Tax=Microbacterium sp. LWO14-1.2 TaxID=3135263 RepID=UPI00313A3C41